MTIYIVSIQIWHLLARIGVFAFFAILNIDALCLRLQKRSTLALKQISADFEVYHIRMDTILKEKE